MIKTGLLGVGLVLFVTACASESPPGVTVRRGALSYPASSQYIFVPAYFDIAASSENAGDVYSWNGIQEFNDPDPDDGSQTVFYAIVNPASGPGSSYNQTVQDHINSLTSQLIQVFGYVDFETAHSMSTVIHDVEAWTPSNTFPGVSLGYTGLTGVFFDVAPRSDSSDLPHAEYLAQLVANNFHDQYDENGSVFNWGATSAAMEPYVNCVGTPGQGSARNTQTWFVTEEMSEATFMSSSVPNDTTTNSAYTWLANYNPMHFINLIHGVTQNGSTVQSVMEKSRRLNAFNVYLTDRVDPCSCVSTAPVGSCPASDMDNSECGITDPAGTGPSGRPWNPLASYNASGSPTAVWLDENLDASHGVFGYPGNNDLAPRGSGPQECPVPAMN